MSQIGFTEGRIWDHSRSDWSGEGARPIAWSAWYPTDDGPERARGTGSFQSPLFLAGNTLKDAKLAARPDAYPVVLLSHGTGGTAASLAWLAQRLAEDGFIVIGVDHHGNSATEPYRAEGFLCWWERARDLTVLLDHQIEGRFAGRLDLARVYAAGFSLGGYTVLSLIGGITDMSLFLGWAHDKPFDNGPREFPNLGGLVPTLLKTNPIFRASWERCSASYRDIRIKAAFLCAPAPTVRALTIDSLRKIDVPVSIAAVGDDAEAPSNICAEWVHENLPNSTFTLLDPSARHYVFLCECTEWGRIHQTELCIDPEGVDRRSIHERAASLAIDLFRG